LEEILFKVANTAGMVFIVSFLLCWMGSIFEDEGPQCKRDLFTIAMYGATIFMVASVVVGLLALAGGVILRIWT
jgi:hypothetical protein